MHIDLEFVVQHYGYAAIFLGALLEGETVLVLGGFAAYEGYLQLPLVVALAAFGGFLGDQLYFGIGRLFGGSLVNRFPGLVPKIDYVDRLVSRYPACSVISVRFLYGFRIAGPIAMGFTSMPWSRFSALNLTGAVIWATFITAIGYVFGQVPQTMPSKFGQHKAWYVVLLLLAGIVVHLWKKRKVADAVNK